MNARLNAKGDPPQIRKQSAANRQRFVAVVEAQAKIDASITLLHEAANLLAGLPAGPGITSVRRSLTEALKARELVAQLIRRLP